MSQSWLEPTLVSAGALILAGTVAFLFKHAARVFKHAVSEIVVSSLDGLKVELDKRFDHNDAETEAAKTLAASVNLELAKQFGGNGNGIRQAVNSLSKDVARLEGAYQHIVDTGVK